MIQEIVIPPPHAAPLTDEQRLRAIILHAGAIAGGVAVSLERGETTTLVACETLRALVKTIAWELEHHG